MPDPELSIRLLNYTLPLILLWKFVCFLSKFMEKRCFPGSEVLP